MGVVEISLNDLKKGLPVDAGIYKALIDEYKEEQSKDGQSINHVFTFIIEQGDFDGSVITGRFNSKAMGFTRPFLAAISGKTEKIWLDETIKKLEEAGITNLPFDGEQCKGQKVGIKVVKTLNPNGGEPFTNIDGYLPYNSVF
jgi:hypothetical protein